MNTPPLLIRIAGHSGLRRSVRVGCYSSRWGLISSRPVVRSAIREVRWWRRREAARGVELLRPQECAELIVWRRTAVGAAPPGPVNSLNRHGTTQATGSAGQAESKAPTARDSA